MSEGSILKREGKRGTSYLLKYEAGRDPQTGKRQTLYVTVNGTKKAAQARLRELLASVDKGTHVDPNKITVGDWIDTWLEQVRNRRRNPIGAKTYERYSELLTLHVKAHVGNLVLQRFTAVNLRNLLSTLEGGTLSAGTIQGVYTLLKLALKAAVSQNVLVRSPCDQLDSSERGRGKQHVMRALDEDGVARLLKAFEGKRLFPLVRVAVGTGMRRGELLALRWPDVDLEKRTVTVRRSLERSKAHGTREKDGAKSASGTRTIPITASLAQFLRDHWKVQAETALALGVRAGKDGLLFPNAPDTPDVPRDPDLESGNFLRMAKRLGFPELRMHDIRHTYATLLIANGASLKAVSQRLGHSDVKVTLSVYAHVLPAMDQLVTEIAERSGL